MAFNGLPKIFVISVLILNCVYALDTRQFIENMVIEAKARESNFVWNLENTSFFQALHKHEKLRTHGSKKVMNLSFLRNMLHFFTIL